MKHIIKLTALMWLVTLSSAEAASAPASNNSSTWQESQDETKKKKDKEDEEPSTTPVSRKRYRSRFNTASTKVQVERPVAQAAPQPPAPVGPKINQNQLNQAFQQQNTQQQQVINNPPNTQQQQQIMQQNLQQQKQMQQQMQMQQQTNQPRGQSVFKRKKPTDVAVSTPNQEVIQQNLQKPKQEQQNSQKGYSIFNRKKRQEVAQAQPQEPQLVAQPQAAPKQTMQAVAVSAKKPQDTTIAAVSKPQPQVAKTEEPVKKKQPQRLSLFSFKKRDRTVAEADVTQPPPPPAPAKPVEPPAPAPENYQPQNPVQPKPVNVLNPKTSNHPASFFPKEKKNLIEVAKSYPNLSTFVSALEASGLDIQIEGDGPYTIFAPTNEAFNQLPRGAMERLMKPENHRQLYAIIAYHIVPGQLLGNDIKTSKVRTLSGKELNVEVTRGNITVDDAEVLKTDMPASNGVIHVIDEVVLPN